jgi:Holliday junction resolvase RusA-like endonuclease
MIHQNQKKLDTWRKSIASEFDRKCPPVWAKDDEYLLNCRFHMKRPKKPAHAYPVKDLDKLVRAVCDALTEHAWDDDSQVTKIEASKEYSEEGNEGVEIYIYNR